MRERRQTLSSAERAAVSKRDRPCGYAWRSQTGEGLHLLIASLLEGCVR